MSNPRPSLGVRCSKSILHTDNLSLFYYFEFDVLMHVVLSATVTSVTIAVRIQMLSVR